MVNEQELNDIQINTPCGSTSKAADFQRFFFVSVDYIGFQLLC